MKKNFCIDMKTVYFLYFSLETNHFNFSSEFEISNYSNGHMPAWYLPTWTSITLDVYWLNVFFKNGSGGLRIFFTYHCIPIYLKLVRMFFKLFKSWCRIFLGNLLGKFSNNFLIWNIRHRIIGIYYYNHISMKLILILRDFRESLLNPMEFVFRHFSLSQMTFHASCNILLGHTSVHACLDVQLQNNH